MLSNVNNEIDYSKMTDDELQQRLLKTKDSLEKCKLAYKRSLETLCYA